MGRSLRIAVCVSLIVVAICAVAAPSLMHRPFQTADGPTFDLQPDFSSLVMAFTSALGLTLACAISALCLWNCRVEAALVESVHVQEAVCNFRR